MCHGLASHLEATSYVTSAGNMLPAQEELVVEAQGAAQPLCFVSLGCLPILVPGNGSGSEQK